MTPGGLLSVAAMVVKLIESAVHWHHARQLRRTEAALEGLTKALEESTSLSKPTERDGKGA